MERYIEIKHSQIIIYKESIGFSFRFWVLLSIMKVLVVFLAVFGATIGIITKINRLIRQ